MPELPYCPNGAPLPDQQLGAYPAQARERVPQPLRYAGYWYDGWYDGWAFTNGQYDEDTARPLPWYWLTNRYYDPVLERFLAPDPSARDGVRSYVYCHDDPADCADPTGLAGVGPGAGGDEGVPPQGLPGAGATQLRLSFDEAPGGAAEAATADIGDAVAAPMQLALPFDDTGADTADTTAEEPNANGGTTAVDAPANTAATADGEVATDGSTAEGDQQQPSGGVYVLRDPSTGEVVRTGMTTDLSSRESDHRAGTKDPATKGMHFEVVYYSDSYEELRGLEQVVYDRYPNARLNKQRPIGLRNSNGPIYRKAAVDFLAKNPGP